jgi:undecaprenyl-diphosphatase
MSNSSVLLHLIHHSSFSSEGLAVSRLRLAVVLTLASGLTAFLLLIAGQVAHDRDSEIARADLRVSETMAGVRRDLPLLRVVLYGVTMVGAYESSILLVPVLALILWLSQWRAAAVILVVCGIGVGMTNKYLKKHFDRTRPPDSVRDTWVYETNESFPSGHSSGSMTIFGMLGAIVWLRRPGVRARTWTVLGFGLLVLAVGFSRVFLGAHFPSDVIAGYCLGGGWLLAGCTLLAWWDDRTRLSVRSGPPESSLSRT